MTETLRPISEPTKLFRLLAESPKVMVYMLDARIAEKPFRGYMVKAGETHGRLCMMPGITVDMMERLVNIDYAQLAAKTKRIMGLIKNAGDVRVTNPAGTDISFSVQKRDWHIDIGDISRRGKHGNLPAGECYTCPVEETFTGRLVISLIDDKLGRGVMEFRKGRLISVAGKGIEAILKNIGNDPTGRVIGEFGVGTNTGARICGNMLEAEKAFGTVHFAIGDSYGIGINKSRHHYDALIEKASIFAKSRWIAKDGQFLV
jgi:leucyl aminopeptidase (aminopeptidase T)